MKEGSDDLDFGSELDRLVDGDPFRRFVFVLTSGTRYEVLGRGQCAAYSFSYGYYPPAGNSAVFLFNQISAVEIIDD